MFWTLAEPDQLAHPGPDRVQRMTRIARIIANGLRVFLASIHRNARHRFAYTLSRQLDVVMAVATPVVLCAT